MGCYDPFQYDVCLELQELLGPSLNSWQLALVCPKTLRVRQLPVVCYGTESKLRKRQGLGGGGARF